MTAEDDELARLRQENTYLRAALAHSDQPCAYCTLPAEDWGKCRAGFPGCARADDAVGCPHLGAEMALWELKDLVRPHLSGPFASIDQMALYRIREIIGDVSF